MNTRIRKIGTAQTDYRLSRLQAGRRMPTAGRARKSRKHRGHSKTVTLLSAFLTIPLLCHTLSHVSIHPLKNYAKLAQLPAQRAITRQFNVRR